MRKNDNRDIGGAAAEPTDNNTAYSETPSASAAEDDTNTSVGAESDAAPANADNNAKVGQSVRAELNEIMSELRNKENRKPAGRVALMAVIMVLLAMIIPASAVAMKSCVLGESSNLVFASEVVMGDDSISFNVDIANSADMYRTYSYRTENGVMFVTVYSLPLGGCGGGKAWPQHLEIPCEPNSLIEVCFEFDDGSTRTIWRR